MENMDFFYKIFSNLPRQGPGSSQSTRKAYAMLKNLPPRPNILDIGCGSGMQTVELAKLSGGKIIAIDNHQPFLDQLSARIHAEQLQAHVQPVNQSMFALSFDEQYFDLIWAEGSIYIIGFENGLQNWRNFLKPDGYFVVSEASWLKDNRPQELLEFWEKEYPAMCDISENRKKIETSGYTEIAHFRLPDNDWLDNYYQPLESRLHLLYRKYAHDPARCTLLDSVMHEIKIFRRYSEYYGYVFYLMQKRG